MSWTINNTVYSAKSNENYYGIQLKILENGVITKDFF